MQHNHHFSAGTDPRPAPQVLVAERDALTPALTGLPQFMETTLIAAVSALWVDDLTGAEPPLISALAQAEQACSDAALLGALVYQIALDRRRGHLDEARAAIARGAVIAERCEPSLVLGAMFGHVAWQAWRVHNPMVVREHAAIALGLWQHTRRDYPFQWIALWPLLAAVQTEDYIQEAVFHAQTLLSPSQQPMPEPLRAMLAGAVAAWDAQDLELARSQIQSALAMAGDHGYL